MPKIWVSPARLPLLLGGVLSVVGFTAVTLFVARQRLDKK